MGLFSHNIKTEEIQHQKGDTTIQEISTILSSFIDFDESHHDGYLNTFDEKGMHVIGNEISDLIKRRFGLFLEIRLSTVDSTAIYFDGSLITNEFLDNVYTGISTRKSIQTEMERELTRLKKLNELKVDRKNARIEGLDKGILSGVMIVGLSLVTHHGVTADELAEAILHEVGHMFTLIEERARVARQNYHSVALKPGDTPSKDVTVLLNKYKDDVEKVQNGEVDYTREELKEMFKGLEKDLLKSARIDSASSGGFAGIEVAADNFVIQLGGGEALTTALAKVYKIESWNASKTHNAMVFAVAVLNGVNIIAGMIMVLAVISLFGHMAVAILTPIVSAFARVLISNIEAKVTMNILPRFKKIRQSTIKQLKILKDKETTRAVLGQITTIDETMSLIHKSNKIKDPTDMIADLIGDTSNNNILINKAKLQAV